jgi:hypothetical protein
MPLLEGQTFFDNELDKSRDRIRAQNKQIEISILTVLIYSSVTKWSHLKFETISQKFTSNS